MKNKFIDLDGECNHCFAPFNKKDQIINVRHLKVHKECYNAVKYIENHHKSWCLKETCRCSDEHREDFKKLLEV
jgi:hypothetical protein